MILFVELDVGIALLILDLSSEERSEAAPMVDRKRAQARQRGGLSDAASDQEAATSMMAPPG